MSYDLNAFFHFNSRNQSTSRVMVYPNQDIAAKLLNYVKGLGAQEISVAECIPESACRLPMPHVLMDAIDRAARNQGGYSAVVGLDAYLALLEVENIAVFMSELRKRLDKDALHIDYLLSGNYPLPFAARYEEARKVVFLKGAEETPEPLHIRAYHKQWARPGDDIGFNALLRRITPFDPGGDYTVFLPDISSAQSGLGKAVTFVTGICDIAMQLYGFDAHLDDAVLEQLLLDCVQCGRTPDAFLVERIKKENCNPRLALKWLLALRQDSLWPAYVWYVKKSIPEQSYMAKVLSEKGDAEKLLWNYAVGAALHALSDGNAQKFAFERAEGLNALADSIQIEPFMLEFIASTRERGDALPFLNCGTFSEKVEIARRAAKEDLSYELPRLYGELYPTLFDYLSPYDWGNRTITAYFREYRRLKISDTLTDVFAAQAYDTLLPGEIPARDAVLELLRLQTDTALLVVDALGIEYLPVLTALAKRYGLHLEPPQITSANIPTETKFNPIQWDPQRTLAPVKGLDNIVHDGTEKHEAASPERCFAATLQKIESDVLNRIADGLTRFSRVVVTADHGSSRLSVIASRDGKSKTLPWKPGEEPLDWRYSTALEDVQRPEECESQYVPDSGETYWVVRGYHRLPKKGGKKYALHGGASLEERLVPVLIFSKDIDADVAVTNPPAKKHATELKDEFEGII